jgi:hypothetical protein
MSNKRGKYKIKPKYLLFLECEKYTIINKYKDLFFNISIGKYPKKFFYNSFNNNITINKNNKSITYNIPDNTEDLTKLLIYIFNNDLNINIKTYEDLKEDKIPLNCKLSDIKDNTIKDKLIYNYCYSKYPNDNIKRKKLQSQIHLNIFIKKIEIENIDIINYKITNINIM